MKKRILAFLAAIVGVVLYSQKGLAADPVSQCMLAVPNYNRSTVQSKINELPVTIIADHVEGNDLHNATFNGNVSVNRGNSHLQADEVRFHQKQLNDTTEPVRSMDALGNVLYNDDQIILKGPRAWVNLNTEDTNVWECDYQMVSRPGRGKASLLKQRTERRYLILENGSFTSCVPGLDSWSVLGTEVIYDREKQVLKIQNARFKIGPVAIFYIPYLRLPLGGSHRSGFLIPNTKYSILNYFELYLPYYLNIAPNMDVTITPHYIQKRGNIMWENEFRYLTQAGVGQIGLHYLPLDRVFKNEHSMENDHHRWMYYWYHDGVMNQVWRFNINYTKVSDPYYFDDFPLKESSSTDEYATQIFSIAFATRYFDATISTRQFQIFSDQIDNNYGVMPQLDINLYLNDIKPFDIRVYGQLVNFVNRNTSMPKAIRVHFEPSVDLLYLNDWARLNAKIQLMATHYQQKKIDGYRATSSTISKESINRILPQFKVEANFFLERDMNQAKSYTHTLEPQIQYLYVPYCDQSAINNYDSSLLQTDYNGLFREHSYGGLDRIASANHITTGVTHRVFDKNAVEYFHVSVGQTYHFTKPYTGDINWENGNKIGFLFWASDVYWRITDHWSFRGDLQYDTQLDNITTSNALMEYHYDQDHIVQLTYHYANKKYIQMMLPSYAESATTEPHDRGISQVGAIASWPISDNWSLVGAHYFNSNTHRMVNQKLGLQCNSCCYAIRIEYERKLNGWNADNNAGKYNNTIGFNIELRGLDSNYSSDTQQMLRSHIFPYCSSL